LLGDPAKSKALHDKSHPNYPVVLREWNDLSAVING
jgi:hypothetical protein